MDSFIFFRALGFVTLALSLLGGVLYWVYVTIQKTVPNLRYVIKYKVLRRKHNEEDVRMLMEDITNNVSGDDMYRTIVLSNKASPEKADELLYVFKELKKKMKGGIKNE